MKVHSFRPLTLGDGIKYIVQFNCGTYSNYGSIKCIPEGPPPGQLRSGMIFFVRNPLPSGTNYCLISPGVGQWVGALFTQRFWFCLSKMVAWLEL